MLWSMGFQRVRHDWVTEQWQHMFSKRKCWDLSPGDLVLGLRCSKISFKDGEQEVEESQSPCAQPLCYIASSWHNIDGPILSVLQEKWMSCGRFYSLWDTGAHYSVFSSQESYHMSWFVQDCLVYAGCQGVINKSALKSVPVWKIKYTVTLCVTKWLIPGQG